LNKSVQGVFVIQPFLASLHPDSEKLLAEISGHITDDMLREIALADYGQDEDRHLAPLRRLRDAGAVVEQPSWYPWEVIELIRNSEPDDPTWKPGSTGVRGHWMRAFASAALLQSYAPPWEYKGDPAQWSETLIQLIFSIRALPIDFAPSALRNVAWLSTHCDLEGEDEQVVFLGVGLLWLALRRNPPPSDRDLVELSKWIVRRESELAGQVSERFKVSDRWLLRTLGAGSSPAPWEALGRVLLEFDLSRHQVQLQEWVKIIGSELLRDPSS
jgi:hypothetical protein